jgi:hypothetical protein
MVSVYGDVKHVCCVCVSVFNEGLSSHLGSRFIRQAGIERFDECDMVHERRIKLRVMNSSERSTKYDVVLKSLS